MNKRVVSKLKEEQESRRGESKSQQNEEKQEDEDEDKSQINEEEQESESQQIKEEQQQLNEKLENISNANSCLGSNNELKQSEEEQKNKLQQSEEEQEKKYENEDKSQQSEEQQKEKIKPLIDFIHRMIQEEKYKFADYIIKLILEKKPEYSKEMEEPIRCLLLQVQSKLMSSVIYSFEGQRRFVMSHNHHF